MKVLERSLLKKKKGLLVDNVEYVIALVNREFLFEALELQEVVINSLPSEETYKRDTKEFIEECLEEGGLLIGVFVEGQMIAYRFINFPGTEERNFGRDLNLKEEELLKVVHFESTLVHPEFIGNGFQRKTYILGEAMIRELGFKYACTLISPKNFYSVNNILKVGLAIKKLKSKYANAYDGEGKLRYILYKDISKTDDLEYMKTISVDSKNIEKQIELLDLGYVGCKAELTNDGFNIIYGINK